MAESTKTLRDEFAMAALTGLLPNPLAYSLTSHEDVAKRAYAIANTMMKARALEEGERT